LTLDLARAFVHAKLSNSALVLARYARHRKESATAQALHQAVLHHRDALGRLKTAPDLNTLRGYEGAAAAAYFRAWAMLLPKEWQFDGRGDERPATNAVNALLNLGYHLLHQAVAGLIQARGLNPYLGHLHAIKGGHMALASDLMEEFRAVTVDGVVLNLCLNGKVSIADFSTTADGCIVSQNAARRFIREIELKLNGQLQHPHTAEPLDVRRLIDAQVRSLAACYRQSDASLYRGLAFR